MALPGAQKRLPLPNVFERRPSTGIVIFGQNLRADRLSTLRIMTWQYKFSSDKT